MQARHDQKNSQSFLDFSRRSSWWGKKETKKIKQKHSFLSLLTHNYCWSNSSWCSSSSYYTRWTHSLFFYFRSQKVLFLLLEKWKEFFCCVYPMKPVTLEILFDDEKIQNLKQLILGNIIAIFCNNFFCEKKFIPWIPKKKHFSHQNRWHTRLNFRSWTKSEG